MVDDSRPIIGAHGSAGVRMIGVVNEDGDNDNGPGGRGDLVSVRNSNEPTRAAKKKKLVGGGVVKSPTGIRGFDELTGGGLPRGRPTLVCGGPGCGKTLFALEFLVRGAVDYGEPGLFVSFEERSE